MGRSLGSAPAIELAAAHADRVCGLIIESGFAFAGPLLRLLGIDAAPSVFAKRPRSVTWKKLHAFRGRFSSSTPSFEPIIPFPTPSAFRRRCLTP